MRLGPSDQNWSPMMHFCSIFFTINKKRPENRREAILYCYHRR